MHDHSLSKYTGTSTTGISQRVASYQAACCRSMMDHADVFHYFIRVGILWALHGAIVMTQEAVIGISIFTEIAGRLWRTCVFNVTMSAPCRSFKKNTMNLGQVGRETPAIVSLAVSINRRFLHPEITLTSFKILSLYIKNIPNIMSLS